MNQPPSIPSCYPILAELGRGTSGIVYEARDPFGRRAAVKLPLLPSLADRKARMARFHLEVQTLAYITWNPETNIPQLRDVGECNGQPYYVREFVDGTTLEQQALQGSPDLRTMLEFVRTIAVIVQRVHAQGFAHRNLHPSNILIASDGTPKLIGFGRVGLLAGSDKLPPGAAGVPPGVDVRGLQEIAGWLFATRRQFVPACLEAHHPSRSVMSPAEYAEAIRRYLQETSSS